MLGKKQYEGKLFSYITLEELVPKENFYRKVNEILDLRFLYDECKNYYGKTGKPSIDPVVFFKFNLYGYFENIIEDRQLVRQASDSLCARLFLGYDLEEKLPWHSTISRTRAIIGEEVFEKLFNKILEMCTSAGLVEGSHLSIDSTLVKANASMESLERKKPKLTVKEFLKKTQQNNPEEAPAKENKDEEKKSELKCVESSKEKAVKKKKINENYVSKTDPDSRVASKPNAKTDLYYNAHYAVDRKARIITDALVVHADRKDSSVLMETLARADERMLALGLKIQEAAADKGFSKGGIFRALEQKQIEGYIPSKKNVNTTGKLEKENFIYKKQHDSYICPEHKTALKSGYDQKGESNKYMFKRKDCQNCPIREKCCGGKSSRQIRRSIYEEEYERMENRLKTARGKKAMRLRKINTEPLFAEAKMKHGLRKFMTRGIKKAQKKVYMIAAVQNLKRLIKEVFSRKQANEKSKMRSFISEITLACQNLVVEIFDRFIVQNCFLIYGNSYR